MADAIAGGKTAGTFKGKLRGKAVVTRIDGSLWVFPNRAGTGPAELKASIAKVFDRAGIADARSHDLRRTFASMAAEMGYGDATIAELLGMPGAG